MERNADDTFGATGDQGSTTGGSSSFGTQGQGMWGSTAPVGGAEYSSSTATNPSGSLLTSKVDQAKTGVQNKLGQAKEKSARQSHSPTASTRVRKSCVSATRMRRSPAAGTGSSVGVASDDRMAQVNDSVARGMHKSADWLRNGDLKADVERQVRDNLAACSSRSAWDTCSVRHSAGIGRSAYGHSRRQWAVASSRCAPARARRGQHVADPAGGASNAPRVDRGAARGREGHGVHRVRWRAALVRHAGVPDRIDPARRRSVAARSLLAGRTHRLRAGGRGGTLVPLPARRFFHHGSSLPIRRSRRSRRTRHG